MISLIWTIFHEPSFILGKVRSGNSLTLSIYYLVKCPKRCILNLCNEVDTLFHGILQHDPKNSQDRTVNLLKKDPERIEKYNFLKAQP